jgi:hypothetical protein
VRRLLIWMLAAVMLAVGVSAQEGPPRLRVPTAEEYLSFAAEIGAPVWSRLITTEAETRYGIGMSAAPFEAIARALNNLPIIYLNEGNQKLWENARLLAWMRENSVNLKDLVSLKTQEYSLHITPINLDEDGGEEYVIDVTRECTEAVTCWGDPLYHAILALNGDSESGYHLIPSELPAAIVPPNYRNSNNLFPLGVQDVTGDDIPEIIVLVSFYDGFDYTLYRLYVLGWRDRKLVDLTEQTIKVRTLKRTGVPTDIWTFAPDTADGGMIEKRLVATDNWNCQREEIERFQWQGQKFELVSSERIYIESFACALRHAEEAMLAGDAALAIEHYEAALQFAPEKDTDYAAMRLVMAYALNGDINAASVLLDKLYEERTGSEEAGFLISAWISDVWMEYQDSPTAINLCLAAHRFAVENPFYLDTMVDAVLGVVEDYPEYHYLTQYVQLPTQTTCDVDTLLDASLTENVFVTDRSPTEQLAAIGWPIHSTFHADLNDDEIDDWLVWIDEDQIAPALFISQGEAFVGSRFSDRSDRGRYIPYLPAPNYTFASATLPDGAGNAVVVLDGIRHSPFFEQTTGMGFPSDICPASDDPASELRIWRMIDNELQLIGKTLVCNISSAAEIELGEMLSGWTEGVSPMGAEILVWDSAQQLYIVVPSATPMPMYTESDQAMIRDALNLYRHQEYGALLEMSNSTVIFNYNNEPSPEHALLATYLRALALEGLGREDEAAAQYAAIAADETYPEWAALAALHLEPTEGR